MSFNWDRRYEIAIGAAVYGFLYFYVIGPFIGQITGFDRPAFDPDGIANNQLLDIFTTARGWIFFVTAGILLFAYLYYRPKLTGHDPSTFWNPPTDSDDE